MNLRALWQGLRWEFGVGGLVAALVIQLSIVYAAVVVPESYKALERKRAELDALVTQAKSPAIATDSRESTLDKLQDFYAGLPREHTSAGWLGKFQRAAVFAGLRLKSGEYRLERRPDSRLLLYHITLPVNGNYGQVRSFIAQVLKSIPYASLDEVQMTRESPQSRSIEARLRFSLYLLADGS